MERQEEMSMTEQLEKIKNLFSKYKSEMDNRIYKIMDHEKDVYFVRGPRGIREVKFDELVETNSKLLADYLEQQIQFEEVNENDLQ